MQKKQWFRKGMAGVLAALMLTQSVSLTAFAAEYTEDVAAVQAEVQAEPQLQNGTAVIPGDATEDEVKEILCKALVANADEVDAKSLEWEYYCEGKDNKTGLIKNSAWGSIDGFESQTGSWVKVTYIHPALKDNKDDSYQVRLAGTDTAVALTKAAKLSSSITLNEGCTVALPYNEDAAVDFDVLRENIFNTVVEATAPALTLDEVTIEYYATASTGSLGSVGKAWMPLEGGKSGALTYPAISAGEQKIRISYAGTDAVYGTSAETTVTIAERPQAPYTLKETPDSVKLTVKEDLTTDYDALRTAIFNAVVASSDVLTADNVTITYYTKAATDIDAKYVALEGEKGTVLTWPAISAGEQKVRISWPGSQTYAPTTIEAAVTVTDREQVRFNLNEGPYEVGMKFTGDQGYDYAATAAAIYNAVVASTVNPDGLTAADVTVEYNTDKTGLTHISYKPLDQADPTGLVKFGTGDWEIRISWAGNQAYRGGSVTVNVTTSDNRLESVVALKDGVSFTYNMDVSVMEQAIFDNAIDWENSTLPDKETLSIDQFTIEYKAALTDAETGLDVNLDDLKDLIGKVPGLDNLVNSDSLKQWVPIEGKKYEVLGQVLGQFPQMGAGEQQIRISYNGNADYRPSENAEGAVTVNKAKVTVKVNSTNIYAGESLPENFITTDPADKFDRYTVYAGITSNVTTGIYLDLPERYTDSAILKLLDPVVEKLYGKSFTQMMNDGVTVGELRELFSTQELLDLLDKLNIDTGTFGQILTVINKLPGVLDSVRISFGTPNRAGLYTVAAVTDNKNYETGVGMGFLLVKMRFSGPKLTWNADIPGGKLTAEQAKTFNFGATLSYNGDTTVDQSGVHYLYSGFTSKWKIYSSTTTPPTEPGRYVVTVCILGGNYMAAPITRSFQITK